MKKTGFNIYFLMILFGASMWGTAGIFVRTAEKYGISEMQIVLLRALFSALVLGVIIFVKDRKAFCVKVKDIPFFVAAGIMSIVLFNFCYYKTMSLTSLSVAAVLLYTAPFFVVIMSVFIFKQRLTIKKIIACVTAFLGCCLVTGAFSSGESISAAALFFGILTGFGYSLYTIFSRLLLDRGYGTLTITFYTFVFAFIGCLPFSDIAETAQRSVESLYVPLVTFLMALFNTVIPYLLYTAGLKGVDPSVAPIIAMVEPVVATLTGIVVYSEPLTLAGAAGIVLVALSVFILNMKGRVKDEHA